MTQLVMSLNRASLVQFLRFVAVGILNTAVTLAVIALCKWCGMNLYCANAVGYVAGLVNSFLWNRQWVFRAASGTLFRQVGRFAAVFIVCYLVQLALVWSATELTPLGAMQWNLGGYILSGYGVATVVGMGVYTVLNFLANRIFTFR